MEMTDRPNILIVDDKPPNLLALEKILSVLDANIVKATSGNQALGLILEIDFALVLLDVQMPEIDGFETAELMRGSDHARHIPIIFVTAISTDQRHVFKGYDAGAFDYMPKPLDPHILIHKVKMFLEAHEQKKRLERMNEELVDALDKLRETQKQLVEAEKMVSLGALVAGVAHEINTPVGVGITAASILIERNKAFEELFQKEIMTRKDLEEHLRLINKTGDLLFRNLQRTGDLIQSFKRVAVDRSTEERRRFRLNSYFHNVIKSLGPLWKGKEIRIDVACDEDLEYTGAPGEFAQILTNFLQNSVIHGFKNRDEGQVAITVNQRDGRLLIKYRDNGKGVSPDDLPKIFDPFYTTNRQTGAGLGLHIVYNIVTQNLKGSIACESKPGHGVLFTIEAPLETTAPNPEPRTPNPEP
ncbi:MAG: hybrid sensor histidine kinase/response regulator [Desulfobacterales bacterium]|nr:hybrid sensor histidine kinase/response regulator [Desulfobacterales bacterium]